jgi:L,D-transpeptidase catalytic domain
MRKSLLTFAIILVVLIQHSFPVNASTNTKNKLIFINTSTHSLFLIENGKMIRTFKVATGSTKTPTPTGTFKIVNKIKNRPYYKLNIPGGSPDNPLGSRWLGLNVDGTWGTTYAIHGNRNERSIGKSVSQGCIRMHNKDIQWLFDQVSTDTPVIIAKSNTSLNKIANNYGFNLFAKKIAEKKIVSHTQKKVYDGQLIVINKHDNSVAFFKDSRLEKVYYKNPWKVSSNIPLGRYMSENKSGIEYNLLSFPLQKSLKNYNEVTFEFGLVLNKFNGRTPIIVVDTIETLKQTTNHYNFNFLII